MVSAVLDLKRVSLSLYEKGIAFADSSRFPFIIENRANQFFSQLKLSIASNFPFSSLRGLGVEASRVVD